MKPVIGLDLGSRRTKAVLVDDTGIRRDAIFESWALNRTAVLDWVDQVRTECGMPDIPIGTTGYGRRPAADACRGSALTEIRAFALGASRLAPGLRTLIDIGGQDAKAMHLDESGKVDDFEMNDRCAAGTGKFFELVANSLGVPLSGLSELAASATRPASLTSTCAVFAESEIIGRLADGAGRAELARGVFHAVAERLHAMLQRTGYGAPALLVGGGANSALARELSDLLGFPVGLHPAGSFFGALGAALHAARPQMPEYND
ncbi:MAG TPA: acyl-CoA dehydratase activase [Candidatus Ozemobacteraceae bacterium]